MREDKESSTEWRVLTGCAAVLLAGALVLAVTGLLSGQLSWPWAPPRTLGPSELRSQASGPSLPPHAVRVEGAPDPRDYPADEIGLPVSGMEGVDLTGISPGGGRGPDGYDWGALRPGSLMVPQVSLVVPVVERGTVQSAAGESAMDLPPSFEAARLRESASLTARRGTTVVAGHVNWADGSWAPMSNLYQAVPGMWVYLADRHGVLTTWRVTGTAEVPQSELATWDSLTDTRGPRRLLLVTCKAEQNPDGSVSFTKNWVVTAEAT